MANEKWNCNQICRWNDPSDGCIKPTYATCPMANTEPDASGWGQVNEKRLIDADALADSHWWESLTDDFDKERARIIVMSAPTVDAVEVVHGRWNPIRSFGSGECYGYCTNCKTPVKADNATGLVMNNRFCHWCGAKMYGEAINED